MEPGDLMFVRPDDSHGFNADSEIDGILVNVAFDAEVMRRTQAAYFGSSKGFGWSRSGQDPLHRTGGQGLAGLTAAFDELVSSPNDQLRLDCFVLRCLSVALGRLHIKEKCRASGSPEWLESALSGFRSLRSLPPGTGHFVKMAGRCPEHVNREVRRVYGKTATDLLNQIRLDEAARRLAASDDDIAKVAWACGFRNLGHFYSLFRSRHGDTPRRMRQKARRIGGG